MGGGGALQEALETLRAGLPLQVGVAEEVGGAKSDLLPLARIDKLSQNSLQAFDHTQIIAEILGASFCKAAEPQL